MTRAKPTPDPNAGKGIERAVRAGIDMVRQAREAAKSASGPASRDKQMAEAHRAAVVQHETEVRRHQGRIASTKAGMIVGGGGTAVLGVASASAAAGGSAVQMVLLGGLAAGSAALGLNSRKRAKDLEAHPPVPRIPPLPPARLRSGARGAEQADRVANALLHIYDLVPNVGRLYPQAGQELWRTVSEVEPLLRGQVERLASLDRIEWEMPGSRAAEAAIAAGTRDHRSPAWRGRRAGGPHRRGRPDARGARHRRRRARCPGSGHRLPRCVRPWVERRERRTAGSCIGRRCRRPARSSSRTEAGRSRDWDPTCPKHRPDLEQVRCRQSPVPEMSGCPA